MIKKNILIEVPDFHLFLHASAKLHANVPLVPKWFSKPLFAAEGTKVSELFKLDLVNILEDSEDNSSKVRIFGWLGLLRVSRLGQHEEEYEFLLLKVKDTVRKDKIISPF